MSDQILIPRPRPLSRRETLLGATAMAAALLMPSGFARAADEDRVGRDMLDRARRWIALLDERQAGNALFDFGDPTRRRWNYMLGSRFAPGLALERMTHPQKDAALDLFATALSAPGLRTAMNIMLQQDILRDEWGKGSPERNRERFSLMVFGNPSGTDAWGWRWEGHHLTLSVTLIGTRIVSHTPKAFSSEPNTVPSGPHKGLVVLPENETLGRALYRDLSPANRRAALVRESSYANILTTAGRENRLDAREGVPLADLPQAQADIVERLMAVYLTDHLAGPLATAQGSRLAGEDRGAIRFAWAGADLDGNSIYYRIHGETFLIEFATVRNQPLHHHTVVHDPERNLGAHLI